MTERAEKRELVSCWMCGRLLVSRELRAQMCPWCEKREAELHGKPDTNGKA